MTKGKSPQRSSRKPKPIFTVGERNFLIDSLLHPLARIDPVFVIVDELLHVANERNPTESFQKFIKYSLPVLIKGVEKLLKDDS